MVKVMDLEFSFLPFSGRRHKMIHKGWRVIKPQHMQSCSEFSVKECLDGLIDVYADVRYWFKILLLPYSHPCSDFVDKVRGTKFF